MQTNRFSFRTTAEITSRLTFLPVAPDEGCRPCQQPTGDRRWPDILFTPETPILCNRRRPRVLASSRRTAPTCFSMFIYSLLNPFGVRFEFVFFPRILGPLVNRLAIDVLLIPRHRCSVKENDAVGIVKKMEIHLKLIHATWKKRLIKILVQLFSTPSTRNIRIIPEMVVRFHLKPQH